MESVTTCIIDKLLQNKETLKIISTTILESDDFKAITEASRQEILEGVTFDLNNLHTKYESMEEQNASLKATIKQLENGMDSLEQYSRRNCILIHGIKEDAKEGTDELALGVFSSKLHVNVSPEDLDRSHRIGRRIAGKSRPIIVKFKTYNKRKEVFSSKRVLKGTKVTLTESLTSRRLELLRQAKNKETLQAAWTSDGRIICLLNEGTTVVLENHDDLAKLSHSQLKPSSTAKRLTRQNAGSHNSGP